MNNLSLNKVHKETVRPAGGLFHLIFIVTDHQAAMDLLAATVVVGLITTLLEDLITTAVEDNNNWFGGYNNRRGAQQRTRVRRSNTPKPGVGESVNGKHEQAEKQELKRNYMGLAESQPRNLPV